MLASERSSILTFSIKKLPFLFFCMTVLELSTFEHTGAVSKGSICTECASPLLVCKLGTQFSLPRSKDWSRN